MSRARHKRAAGGAVERAAGGAVAYAGGDSNVMKEAHERKRGGKVNTAVDGDAPKKRFGKPGRKQGGRIGANKAPLSTAAKISQHGFEESEGGNHSS